MVRLIARHDDHRDDRGDPFADLVGDPGGKIGDLAHILVMRKRLSASPVETGRGWSLGRRRMLANRLERSRAPVEQAEGPAVPFPADGEEHARQLDQQVEDDQPPQRC